MKKRMVSLSLLIMIIFLIGTPSYANSKYTLIAPEKESTSTTRNTTLISGKAPLGTEVTINVYGASNITGKKFSLKNMPEEDDYILISKQNIKSGVLGFGEEVKLIKGINKIIVSFKVDGVESIQRIIYNYNESELRIIK